MKKFYGRYKIVIFATLLAIYLGVSKGYLFNATKSIDSETKKGIKELGESSLQQFKDLSEDKYNPEKYKLNDFKGTKQDDLSVMLRAMQEFKKDDAKNVGEYMEQIELIDLDMALDDSTTLSSYKINIAIENIDKADHLFDVYLSKYKKSLIKIRSTLSAELSKEGFKRALEGIEKTQKEYSKANNASIYYYDILRQHLLLTKEMDAKNQFLLEDGILVIKDDYYVNEYNNSIEKHNAALITVEKRQKDYLEYMQSVSENLKNI